MPTLVIGAQYDTMDPKHMEWMSKQLPHGRYLYCPNGSHLAEYDDQQTYFRGLIAFLRDVDAGRFDVLTRREIFQALAAAVAVPANGLAQGSTAATAATGQPPPVNLFDYEELARKRLPAMAYEYIAGGAGDEVTLRDNRTHFDAIRLKPRVLRDVSQLDTSSTLFGQRLEYPILLAPTAYHKITHPKGKLATARGAGAAHTTMCVSSFATTSIEDVAKAATGAAVVPALRAAGSRIHEGARAARRGRGLPRAARHAATRR